MDYNNNENNNNLEKQSPINNFYINTNPKKENKQNKGKNTNPINHFDNFTQNGSNVEFYFEEDVENIDDNTQDYNDIYDIKNNEDTQKKISKIIKLSTFISLGVLFLTLFIHNIIMFNTINKNIDTNKQTITNNELILESLQNQLNETTKEELKDCFDTNGFILIEEKELKNFTPNPKKVPPIYNEKTNWFDTLCNNISNLFS
ncbi:MAG: hypothetical protein IJW82_07705 [Clostridia bacterium]|nr:hypothetical protein [Clostridia bacterium]